MGSTKMNIALMLFSDGIGGAESVVRQIISHLDDGKFNRFLITNDEIKSEFGDVCKNIFSVGKLYNFGPSIINKVIGKVNWCLPIRKKNINFKVEKISRFILENNITLAHSHLALDHYALGRIKNDSLKKVITIHGSFGLDTKMQTPISHNEIIKAFNKACFVTSACDYYIKLLKDNGLSTNIECCIIENGINKKVIEEKREPIVSDGRLKMTFLGGDRLKKGPDLLVEAIDIVVHGKRRDEVHVDVLREVKPNSKMRRMIGERHLENKFTFVDYVSNDEHLRFISRNDLFINSSRTEGVANTLMEAIGLDKPILATDVGGTSAVVTHGRNGYLCQPTPESLAEGIMFYLDHPAKLKEYSKANRDIKSLFYWPNVVKKYEQLYQTLGHKIRKQVE